MPAQVGKRYIAKSGAELIVTKGGDGVWMNDKGERAEFLGSYPGLLSEISAAVA